MEGVAVVGEARGGCVTAADGGGEGSLLPAMVVLRGDVAELRDFNPKVQTRH
jgi:hypothetical protein